MKTFTVTETELEVLLRLVQAQRGRYSMLKSQYNIDSKDYVRELSSLNKKLKEENKNGTI